MKAITPLKILLIGIALIFDGLAVSAGAALVYMYYPAPALPGNAVADRVVVLKHKRQLRIMQSGEVIAQFPVSLGRNPRGHKQWQGDNKTPEGHYVLDWRNPDSCCHRSLHVSYPNGEDAVRAARLGRDPGGNIMIHALPNGWGWVGRLHRLMDWTHGCIAVTNKEMDVIWNAVPDGTPIEIMP